MRARGLTVTTILLLLPIAAAADWPQFMRDPAHTGDARDEKFASTLGLVAQVKLDDAILTAPAIVEGKAYVVDQMGTAYCLDARANRIVWKTSPAGPGALGSNTSSPCVHKGLLYYGTTAGTLHILRTTDGSVVKSIPIGSPIISAPTLANDSLYFQAVDGHVRCLDLDGNERWRWDHYRQYKEPAEVTKAKQPQRGHPGSYDLPHHGGGDVAVSGKRVVTSVGWDLFCLEDTPEGPKLLWCNRAPNGRDGGKPMSCSISGDWVYCAGMGADGHLSLTRHSLANGMKEKDARHVEAYPWITPAVRDGLTTGRNSSYGKNGIVLYDFNARKPLLSWRDEKDATPIGCSHVLAGDHLVIATLRGEIIVLPLDPKTAARPFRFQTPHGLGIGSTPAIVDGHIHFGCDDSYFYVLGPDGKQEPRRDASLRTHEPRGKLHSATGKLYDWPSTYGNPGNTAFVDDPGLKPPLRLRWAARGFGTFLAPAAAAGGDLLTVSLHGLVTCQEQTTGRMRWRRQMPGPEWGTSSGLLLTEGKIILPRPTFGSMEGKCYCLDQRTGETLWSADIGGRYIWERAAPVAAGGVVAFGSGRKPAVKGEPSSTVIQAWHLATGKPAWEVELNVAGNRSGSIGGCTDGKTMIFTAGAEDWMWKQEGKRQKGETVAIDAATGKVRWRTNELFGTSYPVLTDEYLFLNESGQTLRCLRTSDRSLVWERRSFGSRLSLGPDFLVQRGYGGHGVKLRLSDGKEDPKCRELGGKTHACSAVPLTSKYAFAITVGGLNVRAVDTGELLWHSPGFAPRGCTNPTLANGRVFWPSPASGMIYCWEGTEK